MRAASPVTLCAAVHFAQSTTKLLTPAAGCIRALASKFVVEFREPMLRARHSIDVALHFHVRRVIIQGCLCGREENRTNCDDLGPREALQCQNKVSRAQCRETAAQQCPFTLLYSENTPETIAFTQLEHVLTRRKNRRPRRISKISRSARSLFGLHATAETSKQAFS